MVQHSSTGSIEALQARGRHYDIIQEAIAAYDGYMLDDDYDAQCTLDKIIKKMRERIAMSDAPQHVDVAQASGMRDALEEIKKHAGAPQRYTSERLDNIERICDAALASPVAQESGNGGAQDVRWAVNMLLEKIADKFEKWETMDIWRSDAVALVRAHKHDLTAAPQPTTAAYTAQEPVGEEEALSKCLYEAEYDGEAYPWRDQPLGTQLTYRQQAQKVLRDFRVSSVPSTDREAGK